jgi:hypothetical protein
VAGQTRLYKGKSKTNPQAITNSKANSKTLANSKTDALQNVAKHRAE